MMRPPPRRPRTRSRCPRTSWSHGSPRSSTPTRSNDGSKERRMTKIDPNKMMAQLGEMQAQMEKAQEELKTAYVEHSAGGGAVTVKVSGALEVSEITIK